MNTSVCSPRYEPRVREILVRQRTSRLGSRKASCSADPDRVDSVDELDWWCARGIGRCACCRQPSYGKLHCADVIRFVIYHSGRGRRPFYKHSCSPRRDGERISRTDRITRAQGLNRDASLPRDSMSCSNARCSFHCINSNCEVQESGRGVRRKPQHRHAALRMRGRGVCRADRECVV